MGPITRGQVVAASRVFITPGHRRAFVCVYVCIAPVHRRCVS